MTLGPIRSVQVRAGTSVGGPTKATGWEVGVSMCDVCAAELPAGAKFCLNCGTPVTLRSCALCGTPAERGRFCANCGSPLDAGTPPVGSIDTPVAERKVAERRVTSVLFADLVGFTPLSESKDSEEVRELLSTYFAQCRLVIGRYGGVVEKFIGDAVMAVWGVPVAHENDAERAVRAALDLVSTVAVMGAEVGAPGLAVRVGVVTGEVAVTVGATAEGMVAGDAVNTAARVQSAAEPGRVWVDDTTRSLAAAAITFEDIGEHVLKGKTEPLRLWEAGVVVADVGGGQRVDGLEAPLTGRDSDLRLVKELFHSTQESGRPRLVVLDGEAGVGKSRLAWEFEKYVDGLTALTRWHRGRCRSYGDGVAFWALTDAVRARFGLVEADIGDVVTERIDAGLAELVADPGEREWLRPRLAVLLGAGAGFSFPREDLFAAWTAFLERLSDNGNTVVLVLDDAQHADDGLLDFLDHLLANCRAPVFVLALARPELLEGRPALGGRRTTVVRLQPLDDVAMSALVDRLVVGLPASTRAALVARADGVPLFAVETVRALIDRDLVVPRDGQYVPADGVVLDLDAVGAPASLQALVAARLDALSPQEKRVVTDASVLGLTFTRDGLVALGADMAALDALLSALARKEIVALQADRFSAERGQYRFVQSVVRQVAYATQARRDRKTRHLAAAAHLAAQPDPGDDLARLVAQHLIDAIDAAPGDRDTEQIGARARDYLERAAARARTVGAPAESQRLLEAALLRTDDPTTRSRLHLAAAWAAADAGDTTGGLDHAQSAATLFDERGDVVQAGHAAAAHARVLIALGENAEAIAVAEPRWQVLDRLAGAEPALLSLAGWLSSANQRRGDWAAQARYTERMLMLAEALDDQAALALAHIYMSARLSALGAAATAQGLLRTAVAIARAHDLAGPLAIALINLGALLNPRDLPAALENTQQAVDAARRSGVQDHVDLAILNYSLELWTAGRLDEAQDVLQEAWSGNSRIALEAGNILEGWLADARGDPVPERVAAEEITTDDESRLAWITGEDVTRALAFGDTAMAARLAGESMAHLSAAFSLDDDFYALWPRLVLAALAADDVDLAQRLLDPVTTELPARVPAGVAAQLHRLRGLLGAARGDDPQLVETELRAGIAALAAFGAVGFRGQAQEELARWLVGQHQSDEAAPLIEAARTTYVEIGARGWLARLDAWAGS